MAGNKLVELILKEIAKEQQKSAQKTFVNGAGHSRKGSVKTNS